MSEQQDPADRPPGNPPQPWMLPPGPPPPYVLPPADPAGPGYGVPSAGPPAAVVQPQPAAGPGYDQPGSAQPATVQPATVQPATVQPATVQPAPAGYGQPRYGQPGYGQPAGYATPGYRRPARYGQPQSPYASPARPRDPALAEWWRRLLARLIDGIVLAVVLGLVLARWWVPALTTFLDQFREIMNRFQGTTGGAALDSAIGTAEAHFASRIFGPLLVFYAGAFAYDWIQHALWGQTIGKRALGTRVVTADGHGKIGIATAGGRAAMYALVPAVPLVGGLFGLLNELWLTWDPRRQCLHDKAAHTVVIKKNYQSSGPQAGSW